MENLVEMGVVNVREDAEQLAVDVLYGRWERRGKVVTYTRAILISESVVHKLLTGIVVTCFCWEGGLVAEQVLHPSHDIVDILGSWKMNAFAVLIYPAIIQPLG